MLFRRRPKLEPAAPAGDVPGSGAAIYEIDGRLLIRTVDGSDMAGIERDETDVIEGYPDVDADTVGSAVVAAVDRAREVPRPAARPTRTQSEYAALLIAASPRKHRSFRAWQRAARHVSVSRSAEGWWIERWYPDLGRGGRLRSDSADRTRLPRDATPGEVGAEVLAHLVEPPLAKSY